MFFSVLLLHIIAMVELIWYRNMGGVHQMCTLIRWCCILMLLEIFVGGFERSVHWIHVNMEYTGISFYF